MTKDGYGTVVSRIDRLIYSRGEEQRRRSKSQTRDRSSPGSSRSKGLPAKGTLETNPLQQAVFRGCVECIRVLVETPPYWSVDKTCGPEGLRPIHIAAREGHLSVLRFLAKAGGNVDKCDAHGSTGLHHAAWGGQLRAARWLLRHGATLTLDKRGKTPIQVASDLDHIEIVTLLTNHSSCGTVHANTKGPNYAVNVFTEHCAHRGTAVKSENAQYELTKQCSPQGPSSKLCKSQQDLSSSGNFSLATSSGSASPSSISPTTVATAAAIPCGHTGTVERTSSVAIGAKPAKSDTSPSVAPFYLHPPRNSPSISPSSTVHRQVTVTVAVEPFYLHPPPSPVFPSILTSVQTVTEATQETSGVTPDMGPVTPVTSGTDFVPKEPTVSTVEDKEDESSDGSPPPTPPTPPPKTKLLKSIDLPPPPPPPPPMPGMERSKGPNRNGGISQSHYAMEENEYEDIDEMEEQQNSGSTRKLNRSVSAPAPPHRLAKMTDQPVLQPKGVPPGSRRPFIPPNFPDPPKDALIKPSEYLKSIQQNKSKCDKGIAGASLRLRPASGRVEEVIKALNGDMAVVLEEHESETEHQEMMVPESHHGNGIEDTVVGSVRLEEIKRVNLRKTPISRTVSAPAVGHVLPDVDGTQQRHGPPGNGKPRGAAAATGPPRAAIIAELAESSQLGGVREWKEELRRREAEEEKVAAKEMATIYSPLKFVSEIPETDENGQLIPEWKRQMMAKKAAVKAKQEAEEQRKQEIEAKRASAIPPWKRQLLQRRDSDSKSAQ